MPSLFNKNKNVTTDNAALAIKAIELVIKKGKELIDPSEALNFCQLYVNTVRVLKPHKEHYRAFFDGSRKPFLESFVLCWDAPIFAKFQPELTAIGDEHLASLEQGTSLLATGIPFVGLNRIVLSALLFASDDNAARYFFSRPQEERDEFFQLLNPKNEYALLKWLAKLFSATATPAAEKQALIEKFKHVLAHIKQRHVAEALPANVAASVSKYVASYFAYFPTVSRDDIENRTAEFVVLADCLAVPGVLEQVGQKAVRNFLQKVPSECWRSMVYQLTDTVSRWCDQADQSQENGLIVTAIKDVHFKLSETLMSDNPQKLAENQNRLQALVAVMTVPCVQPNWWNRILNIFRKRPEKPKFTIQHVQELICCTSKESAEKLLDRYYPELTAAQFINFMQHSNKETNPILCAENRLLLCNKLFDPKQATLRQEVYQQLGRECPVTLMKWLKPLDKKDVTRILTKAFVDESFQKACAKLELYEVMSLQEECRTYQVNNGRDCLQKIYEDKTGGPRSSKPVDLQALIKEYPHLAPQIKENPAFTVFMLYCFVKTAEEQKKLDQILAPKEEPVVVISKRLEVASNQCSLTTDVITVLGTNEANVFSLRNQIAAVAEQVKHSAGETSKTTRAIKLISQLQENSFLATAISAADSAVKLSKAAQKSSDIEALNETLAIVNQLLQQANAAHQEATQHQAFVSNHQMT